VTRLQEVKVYPYATEEAFKKAFLERELADALQRQRLRKNLEQSGLNTLAMQMATSSNRNFLNYSDLLTYSQANRNNVQTISTALGNPFAWASFIKDLKKSSQTKKIWEKRFNEAPNENISREKYLKEIPKN
ncbi:MAG: carboxypeptidase-like regulatory domain-containing protein, partial [Pseudarcicella sp.]|nr:carboxypeptidase-like regulatory domain-containing protein [Pseudarcicella sp.]